jgi:hypothetical protein
MLPVHIGMVLSGWQAKPHREIGDEMKSEGKKGSYNKFYHSPSGMSEGKKGNHKSWYMSPGSGGQGGKVGRKRNKFMKNGPNSTDTTGG